MALRRKCTGAKPDTEAADVFERVCGRGALHAGRSITEKGYGQHGSENAGVSSEMQVRILHTESLRIPGEGSSALGQSGPNANLKGEADGKQAENPAPAYGVME